MVSRRWTFVLLGMLAATFALPTWPVSAGTLARWVQLGPAGIVSARAISDGACPELMLDGVSHAMATRAEADKGLAGVKPAVFPVRVCEATVPVGTVAAVIDGKALPLPRGEPRRVVIVGDTGCRIGEGGRAQACNDPDRWPFPRLAAAAAASRPDLVIHVGDYLYREDACLASDAGCAGSPHGYGWDAWNADLFAPAAELMAAAPWVVARGNHEDCDRAGEGWFRFFHFAAMPAACVDLSGMYAIALEGLSLVVVDSAHAGDPSGAGNLADSDGARTLREQFQALGEPPVVETWVITHRPLNALRAVEKDGKTTAAIDNGVEQAAFGSPLADSVSLIVSGHVHDFETADFGDTRPSQLVVGNSGAELDRDLPTPLAGTTINGAVVTGGTFARTFGYMVLDIVPDGWDGHLFDDHGRLRAHCFLADRSLTCRA
jgi:hypothetical protein